MSTKEEAIMAETATDRETAPAPELSPQTCPRCGRPSHFRYATETEARRRTPLCWGENESDCPGYGKEGSDVA